MKRLFPISLAVLLVIGSLGHVLAAAFCPLGSGRGCCFAKTVSHTPSSFSSYANNGVHDMHMDGIPMEGMNMDDMLVAATSMDYKGTNEMAIDAATIEISIPFSPAAFEEAVANKLDQPVKSCAHCLGHLSIEDAPVSFVGVSDQSGKEFGSVLLPVSNVLIQPARPLAPIGLPREHAPPGGSAPRHVLISVFLI